MIIYCRFVFYVGHSCCRSLKCVDEQLNGLCVLIKMKWTQCVRMVKYGQYISHFTFSIFFHAERIFSCLRLSALSLSHTHNSQRNPSKPTNQRYDTNTNFVDSNPNLSLCRLQCLSNVVGNAAQYIRICRMDFAKSCLFIRRTNYFRKMDILLRMQFETDCRKKERKEEEEQIENNNAPYMHV